MNRSVITRSTKKIQIQVAGADEVREVTLQPGETVHDMLKAAGLLGYQVSRGAEHPLLSEREDAFAALPDGSRVYATTAAEAGSVIGWHVARVPGE